MLSLPDASVTWTVQLDDTDPDIFDLWTIDGGRIINRLTQGHFRVLSIDGSLEYSYDPHALAEADPDNDLSFYSGYWPFDGATADTLTLFDGTSTALTLDLELDSLTERVIDAAVPPGYMIRPVVLEQKLFLVSATQLRVRTLTTP